MEHPEAHRGRDVTIMVLLVLSVALVFWHGSTDDASTRRILEWVDLALVVFFVAEWAWRVRHADHPRRAAVTSSWELLGMVPLLLPLPGFLRVLRLVRLARILRVFGSVGRFIGATERIAKESHIPKIALASGAITLAGALLVWALERESTGQIQDFRTAIWWAIVTVTTVGYGDVTPVTTLGRFVASILMVTGIGTIGLLASSLASVLVVNKEENTPVAAGAGVAVELERLVALRQAGQLSDDEFAAAKRKVLE